MSVNDCPTCRNPTYMGEPLLTQSKAAEAQRLALDLRNKATNIDGWCSSCQQIDKHKDWCPWTRLLTLLGSPDPNSVKVGER